jgi:hypothetical protein
MQYGAKITIWHKQWLTVPNSKRELKKSSEQQPNYAERSKMAEIYKWKFFERLEYKNIKKKEKSMQQGKRMQAGTRNYYFFTWPYFNSM